MEKSNIGIPGEWLFRIDAEQIYLCGAGFQGLECVDSCLPTQWYLDCSRQCHCADGNACNTETGECPDAKCNPGWRGSPICDEDIDECSENESICPNEQPDCVNTPGAYLCLCFEYDNSTNSCLGSRSGITAATIAVPVMPLHPQLPQLHTPKPTTHKQRIFTTTETLPPRITNPPRITSLPIITNPPRTTTPPSVTQVYRTTLPFEKKLEKINKALNTDFCLGCDPHARCLDGRCQCNLGWKGNGHVCDFN